MFALIGFIIATGVLVFVHEFGHYYVAKISGIKIEEFSIGFGKKLFSRTDGNGVEWKIRAIPLGGFVRMYGDQNIASVGANDNIQDKHLSFHYQPWYIRFCVIAAGPLANYLLAIVIFSAVYFSFGKIEIPAVIDDVVRDSPAEKAGLLIGDRIIKADGHDIGDFVDLQKIIMINLEQEIPLLIERDGEFINLLITPAILPPDQNRKAKIGYIGIASKQTRNYKNMGVIDSIMQAVTDVIDSSILTLKALGQMITGQRSTDEIAGPLQIAQESGKSLSHNTLDFILFIAILSVNLGLINLLPIPLLDGGHLAVIICELIIQKSFSKSVHSMLLRIGMIIITFLIVISVSNDIKSLIF